MNNVFNEYNSSIVYVSFEKSIEDFCEIINSFNYD